MKNMTKQKKNGKKIGQKKQLFFVYGKLQVIAKMGSSAPLLVFPTWGAQPLASENAAQRAAGRMETSNLLQGFNHFDMSMFNPYVGYRFNLLDVQDKRCSISMSIHGRFHLLCCFVHVFFWFTCEKRNIFNIALTLCVLCGFLLHPILSPAGLHGYCWCDNMARESIGLVQVAFGQISPQEIFNKMVLQI